MKYRVLPIEKELQALEDSQGFAAAAAARAGHVRALVRHPGFQVLVLYLRELEQEALNGLRLGGGDPRNHVCTVRCIHRLRRCIEVAASTEEEPVDLDYEELEEFFTPDIVTMED